MLASSNGLGNQSFKLDNVGSNPIASTRFFEYRITDDMWKRVEEVIPYPGFFSDLQTEGGYIAGGFARYVLGLSPGMPFKDVDVFCLNDSFDKILDIFVLKPWNKHLKDSTMVGNRRHIPYHSEDTQLQNTRFLTYNARCTKHYGPPPMRDWIDFQFISNPEHKSLEDIINSFDITVCSVYIDFFREKIFCRPEFVEDELSKNLRLVQLKHEMPLQLSEFRTYKYLEKGYKLTLKEALRIQELIKEHPENENTNYMDVETRDKAFLNWIVTLRVNDKHVFHSDEEFELLEGVVRFSKLPVNLI